MVLVLAIRVLFKTLMVSLLAISVLLNTSKVLVLVILFQILATTESYRINQCPVSGSYSNVAHSQDFSASYLGL